MSALRKAGVWLGLIEDDEDRGYGYDDRSYDDDYPDDEMADAGAVVRARVVDRLAGARAERNSTGDRVAERGLDRHGERPGQRIGGGRDGGARDNGARDGGMRDSGARDGGVRDTDVNLRTMSRPGSTGTTGGSSSPAVTASAQSAAAQSQTASAHSIYPTRDNLALAPEPQPVLSVAQRVSAVDDDRRYQITTLHPTTYNEARTIGEHFRDGVPVIMNLTEMAEADAKRLVDFAAGLAFGLRGTMERVTNRVFLLSPANVRVTDEDRAKIAEGGFFFQS